MTRQCRYLFVYGLLRSEFDHEMHRKLAESAELVGTAAVPGKLYDLGRYPGMIRSADESDRVRGEVWKMKDPGPTLALMDHFEEAGPENSNALYHRRLVTAQLDDGDELEVWAYWYARDLEEAEPVPSGDYAAYRRA